MSSQNTLSKTKIRNLHPKLDDEHPHPFHVRSPPRAIKINQLQPTDVTLYSTFWTGWRKSMFPERSVRVFTETKTVNTSSVFDLRLHVIAKSSNGRSGETFCFLENCLLSKFKFCSISNVFFFTSFWLAYHQLSWNVLLFSCNPVGQLCLSGPSYSSRTVIPPPWKFISSAPKVTW